MLCNRIQEWASAPRERTLTARTKRTQTRLRKPKPSIRAKIKADPSHAKATKRNETKRNKTKRVAKDDKKKEGSGGEYQGCWGHCTVTTTHLRINPPHHPLQQSIHVCDIDTTTNER